MLEAIRQKLSRVIYPKAKARDETSARHLMSSLPANIPVYTDMTVRKATREGYKTSIYVYRAVRTIIQAASAIPWIVLDKNEEPIEKHPFELVMRKPNPEFSGQDLIEMLIAHLELVGNAIWQPLIVRGQIKEIWPVMPDLVKPVPSGEVGKWIKHWQVTGVDGGQYTVPPEQFIHFMQVDPGNPYWGVSPLMAAARTVDTDNEAQDTQKVSMQNRGLVDGVFTHETPLTQDQFEEARRQVREKFLDKAHRREPWVLGAGAKWNQMSLTPVEMDFIASRLANLRAIASAFGLDPWWLGDRTTSTYNNVQEARKALYEDVVIPLLDDIRSTINLKIAPMYGEVSVTYDLSGIPALREDFGKKVTQAKDLFNMGVPFEQINTRLEMGFEEFVGWDSGYLPVNLLPTGASKPEAESEDKPEAEPKKEPKVSKAMTPRDWQEAYEGEVPHWAENKDPSLFAQDFAKELADRKLKAVLEVGCGNGRDSIFFAKAGFNVTGIDIATGAVRLAEANAREAEVEVDFVAGNVEELAFEDKQFDAVFSLSVLHSTDLSKSIPEIDRVMIKSGVAFIYLYGNTEYADGHIDSVITVDDYIALVKGQGFQILDFYSEQEEGFDQYGEKHLILVSLLQKDK